MTGGSDDGPALAALCRQVRVLTTELGGPLRRVRVSRGDAAVEVEWQPVVADPAGAGSPPGPAALAANGAGVAAGPPPTPTAPAEPRRTVDAPLVGTFYRAPEPGARPYVEVGDAVNAGQVIGIVEAMKLMNQVTAEHTGTVAEVLVEDGHPVEFGQPLIALVPGQRGRTEQDVREGADRQPR
nr:acetyl-CoA carboxylase biotin carboxyl carrier protein [Micromonospora sp. DSM 115978]